MGRRGALAIVVVCVLGVLSGAAVALDLPPGPKVTAPGRRSCGGVRRFGHRFPVEADGVRCGEARRLLATGCRIRIFRQWSCFSFREDEPFVVWFPTRDLWKRKLYPDVLLRRYPCSQARVTPRAFGTAPRGFPTRRQLLADDVLRCELLGPGDSSEEVERLLGPPDEREPGGGVVSFVYGLGPERDSFDQIDPELLLVELKDGHLTDIEIVQG
jgi:hypothetical protein